MIRLMLRLGILLGLLVLMAFASGCSASSDDTGKGAGGGDEDTGAVVPEKPDNNDELRDSTHFVDISYSRPDADKIQELLGLAIAEIKANETTFDQQLAHIKDIDPLYEEFITMHTYATIKTYEDSTDEIYVAELKYLDEKRPSIARLIEDLAVCAANSPHAVRFESEYFGDDLIENYAGGGVYTDELVKLLEDEAELEARYTTISPATVQITYNGRTDTYENMIAMIEMQYGRDSVVYQSGEYFCALAYEKARDRLMTDTFISLLKVRSKIAEAYGYGSYIEYAYERLGHDYSVDEMERFLADVAEYMVPVYSALSIRVFGRGGGYSSTVEASTVINTLSTALSRIDGELAQAYAYMLAYGLYDISDASVGRYNGAFTTYLDGYEAPYLFITSSGSADDYMTLSHEFGHFYDYYLNGSSSASLDLMEVSSQGLELLVLLSLIDEMSWKDYKQLYYGQMESVMLVFMLQGFYAKFEHIVYGLSYYEITEARLDDAVAEAAEAMSLNTDVYNDFSDVMIPHIFIEPLYVQSYCVSLACSLEIFFAEITSAGEGYKMYRALLNREDYAGFDEQLEAAGIGSPFRDGAVMKLADSIYFSLLGSHFFDEYKGSRVSYSPYSRRPRLRAVA